jgi:plasmid stability protein
MWSAFDMHFACSYAVCMSTLQIRNVPDDLHRELKSRAALAGMSVSEYLLLELRRSLERPTRETLLRRLSKRAPVRVRPGPAAAVRAERKRR